MLNPEKQSEIALPLAGDMPHTGGLSDLQRLFGEVSEEAGADSFSLFLVSQTAECRRLTPFMDTTYPCISKRTEFLALTLGERFARRMAGTTQPCWWAENDESLIAASLTRCLWAERLPAPQGLGPALALPLLDERGQAGAIVMSGNSIALSMPALADTQARCLALFAKMTGLRPAAPRTAPPISPRELECLKLTANGQTSEEIAVTLGLSVHTANQYLTNSTQKLNAMNRMHAVAKAIRMGLID
jgi:DNA-binding CsgD family transcriptional regulator